MVSWRVAGVGESAATGTEDYASCISATDRICPVTHRQAAHDGLRDALDLLVKVRSRAAGGR